MPTGYTAGIEEGQKFEDFIMACARAFGACIEMRDKSIKNPVPEKFEESNYHEERYNKSVVELKKYKNMSDEDADKESEIEYKDRIKSLKKHIEKIDQREKLYEKMLTKVNQWIPPSPEHIELKNFMLQQIDISMDKGSMKNFYSENKIIKLSGKQWKYKKIKKTEENIEYHMKEWIKETKRIADRNKWIKQLRDSIK